MGDYLVMPDHIHLFVAPGVMHPENVKMWASYWKRLAGDELNSLRGVFQRDCWDTQMRSRDHYDEKLSYMRENPVRAGLVDRSEDWPYQGCLNRMRW